MKHIKKLIALLMAIITILCAMPVFAQSSIGSIENDMTIGEDVEQNVKTTYDEVGEGKTKTDVYLTVDNSNMVVSVPTTIILDGTSTQKGEYIGNYSVGVSGDMAGDEILVVEPESSNVTLQQKGKSDKTATISQMQTEFSCDDLSNNTMTSGEVKSIGLTAGSWNGSTNFIISTKTRYVYYSTIELATTDASNLTTENADVKASEIEKAEAGLFIKDNVAYIRLMKNADEVGMLLYPNTTVLDLGNNTITFSNGKYITYGKDFSIYNGTMSFQDAKYGIFGLKENTESTLNIRNIVLNGVVTSSITSDLFLLESSSKEKYINSIDFVLSGTTGGTTYSALSLIVRNPNSINVINNCNFTHNIETCDISTAIQFEGIDTLITNPVIDINNVSSNYCTGINEISTNKNTIVNNPIINISCQNSNSCGIQLHSNTANNTTTINGADVFVETINSHQGMGIISICTGDFIINSTNDNPVSIYGKQWGLQTSPYGKTTITGGEYTSTNHTAYIEGDSNIYNAKFYIANRDKYTVLDTPYGFYCGGTKCPEDAVVNITNCTIGNPNDDVQQHQNGIVAQRNYKMQCPAEINLYDTNVYGGLVLFSYHTDMDNPGSTIPHTKINLYGNTKLFDKFNNEYTKQDMNSYLSKWKNQIYYDFGTPKWTGIGNQFINAWGNVQDGEIKEVYIAEDAGIYDYR